MDTEQEVRQYLAVLVIAAQRAGDRELLQMVRAEMHRIVKVICIALNEHARVDGRCLYQRRHCDYAERVHRELLLGRHELRS